MKKNATRYCAGPAYYRMCSTDVYCSKQPAAVAPKETITHHFRFWNWAEENCRCSQNLWRRAENKERNRNRKTFVNGLLGFITLGIYTPLEARVYCSHIRLSCPSIWATLSALLINILLGSFQLFLHSDQPLSEVNESVQRCLLSGRLHYPRRRRWLHALTDRLL